MADDDLDHERLAELAAELQQAGSVPISVHPQCVLPIVGLLQLALRHPDAPPSSSAIAVDFVRDLARAIGPKTEAFVESSW